MELNRIIERALQHIPPHAPGVVAVSGGADSVALLRALALGQRPIMVAHVQHGLRGEASIADAEFVADLAATLNVPFQRLDLHLNPATSHIESNARRLRYDWLATIAQELGCSWVSTGHTADDQAETVLFRILRGTGVDGLAGIPAQRPLAPGVVLVRPMLSIARTDIVNFLREIGQNFREDASNADRRFSRNRIRHELLPILHEYNPRIREHLATLAQQAAEWEHDHAEWAMQRLQAVELPREDRLIVLDRRALRVQPAHHRRELLRCVWEREKWPMGEMGFADWQRAAEVIDGPHRAIDLPGGISLRRKAGRILIGPRST